MPENSHPIPSPVDLAALIYDCDTEDLLSYHEFPDGSVTIIASTGQKFHYSAARIHEMLLEVTEDEWPEHILDETPADFDGNQVLNDILAKLARQMDPDTAESAGDAGPRSQSNQAPLPEVAASEAEQDPEQQKGSKESGAPILQPDPPDEVPDAQPPSPFPQQAAQVETSTQESGGAHAAKKRKTRSSNRRKNVEQSSDSSHDDES
jgi:hypothetical protein